MAKAKVKQEKVVDTTDQAVETKVATAKDKLKVKTKRPSIKSAEISNEPIKVDMSNTTTTDEKPVEDKKEEELQVEEVKEEVKEEIEIPAIEEVTNEDKTKEVTTKEVKKEVKEEVKNSEDKGIDLPENIQKVVDFMNETGGDLNDYVELNKDYSKLDDKAVLREYYNKTKPHLNTDEIDFLLEDSFDFDEEVDEPTDIKRKKLAFKEQVATAKNHMDKLKSTYYKEIKAGSKLNPEQQKAIDFFSRYNKEQGESKQSLDEQRSTFQQKTNEVFNDTFKGFEYNVGEKKFRINVKDVNTVKDNQGDLNNFVNKFTNKRNLMENAQGYHKALFTAENSDAIANHFYEQGKADALKTSVANAKNIDMEPRKSHETVTDTGYVVKSISGDSSNKLRFKIRK